MEDEAMIANREQVSVSSQLAADNPIFFYLAAASRYEKPVSDAKEAAFVHQAYLQSHGWECLAASDKNPEDYRGVAYVNHATREIVIAHRGTNIDEKGASYGNIEADLLIALKKVPVKILNQSFAFGKNVIQSIKQNKLENYTIHQTGFSLGGFLAGIMGGYFKKQLPKQTGLTISIDSPGTLPATQYLMAKGYIADNKCNTYDYITEPFNLVGLCNERFTKEIRVLKKEHHTDYLDSKDNIIVSQNVSSQTLLTIVNNLKSHHLNGLIEDIIKQGECVVFTRADQYAVRDIVIEQGSKPLQLNMVVSNAGGEIASDIVKMGSGLLAECSDPMKVLLIFLAIGLTYHYRNKIAQTVNNYSNQVADAIQNFQTIVNKLHEKFRVSGLSIKPARMMHVNDAYVSHEHEVSEDEFMRRYRNGKDWLDFCNYPGAIERFDSALKQAPATIENKKLGMTYLARGNAYYCKNANVLALFNYHMACQFDFPHVEPLIIRQIDFSLSIKDVASTECMQTWLLIMGFSLEEHLNECITNGEFSTARHIIKNLNVSVDTRFANGLNPLLTAIAHGHLAMVEWLLDDAKADYNCQTADGKKPVELAEMNKQYYVAMYMDKFERHHKIKISSAKESRILAEVGGTKMFPTRSYEPNAVAEKHVRLAHRSQCN